MKTENFIHRYTAESGETRYAVAYWDEKAHEYRWPTNAWVYRHGGPSEDYARHIEDCPYRLTYRSAYHVAYNMFMRSKGEK